MNRRKKVFLIAPPFSGHLHPLLGIGMRLQEIADVTVLSTPGVAASCELPFHPILPQHEKAVWAIAEPGVEVKNNPLLLFRQLRANIALMGDLRAELTTLYAARRPDLVIVDFTVPVAGITALEHLIPWWTTVPSPCVFETSDGPPSYFGGLAPANTCAQRLLHAVLRQATRAFKRTMGLVFRRQLRVIGFPGIYRADGSEAVYSPQRILALGIPEIEFPRTYPPHFHFVGPALHTPRDDSPGPQFSADGRPHVLITLGTHLLHAKTALEQTVRGIAARHPDIVFHFTHGRAAAGALRQEGNFHQYSHVSYARHLSRYAAVIHHAGTGIFNHCLLHGIPSVVIPQDFDQFDYATRLVEFGLALRARKNEEVETALLQALGDQPLKARCAAMSTVLARQDGAAAVTRMVAGLDLPA